MNKQLSTLFTIIFTITLSCAHAQERVSVYCPPLDGALSLSANFGEVRSTHFHTGVDFKTGGVIGKSVRSVADGYISRVFVSPTGYGHAIYITHPSLNRMSVYGHLSSFSGEVASYVRDYQYRNKRFSANLYPEKSKFIVKKGDIIAKSGNSGSSGGPHLHFEIRNTTTGYTLDPLNECGYTIADTTPPKILSVLAVELDDSYGVAIHTPLKAHPTTQKSSGIYSMAQDTIFVTKDSYLAFEVTERKDNSTNIFGVRSMTLQNDGIVVWSYLLDKISFDYGRSVNSFALYPQTTNTRNDIIRTYVADENKMYIYPNKINNGVIYKSQLDKPRNFTLTAKDEAGNSSVVSFVVALSDKEPTPIAQPKGEIVLANKFYSHKDSIINFMIPAYGLQQSGFLDISYSNNSKFPLSRVIKIGDKEMPFKKSATLSIRLANGTQGIPASKLFIAQLKGSVFGYYMGGEYKEGMVTATIPTVGSYAIMCDTIAPVVQNKWNNDSPPKYDISFKVTDSLSGVKSYEGYIDDKWVLFEYDPKSSTLIHNLSSSITEKGHTHKCRVVVSDKCGNITTHNTSFYW